MTETPTPYDEIQDGRLDDLESLVTAEYRPPESAEYSYPVSNQGITQEQYNNMMLPMGDGIIHRGYTPYYLRGHDSDSETNQRNTLLLKVDSSDQYSGSVIAGFYHRLTEDMELPFPPVTSATDYHVTVTYDPRRFRTDPLRIEVWQGKPPTNQGQQHIVLNVVRREPNQLLSQAPIQRYRQYVSPTISVQNPDQLPDPSSVLYGTVCWAGRVAYKALGPSEGWRQLTDAAISSDTATISGRNGWTGANLRLRKTPYGVEFSGRITTSGANDRKDVGAMPSGYSPNYTFSCPVQISSAFASQRLTIDSSGNISIGYSSSVGSPSAIYLDGIFMPLSQF